MSSSGRFFVMSFFNMYICGQAKKRLSKDGKKITLKKYMKFFLFFSILLTINQAVFFFFEPPNLYDEIQISRSMPVGQIKQHQQDLEIKIMSQEHIPMKNKVQMVQKIQSIVKVLSHPATRLMYDTFGITDMEYAWAFKSQMFLLQMIIQSAIFYFICIFMNMMSKSRDQMKQALKIQMMIIFLVFLWEVQVIMRTESRFHESTDWVDGIYTALPIFQRRQIMKLLLFPITNVCHFFLKFYIPNQSQKKLMRVGNHRTLRNLTTKVRQHCAKIKDDQHVEDRVQVAVEQIKSQQPLHSDIYLLQRQVVRGIFLSESQNILVDAQVLNLLRRFHILNISKQQQFMKNNNIKEDEQIEKNSMKQEQIAVNRTNISIDPLSKN